jgi:hypothetical protein
MTGALAGNCELLNYPQAVSLRPSVPPRTALATTKKAARNSKIRRRLVSAGSSSHTPQSKPEKRARETSSPLAMQVSELDRTTASPTTATMVNPAAIDNHFTGGCSQLTRAVAGLGSIHPR